MEEGHGMPRRSPPASRRFQDGYTPQSKTGGAMQPITPFSVKDQFSPLMRLQEDTINDGHSILPPALDAALDDPLSLLALEDWRRTHQEHPGQHVPYESRLLSCEARLRKLDRLAVKLRPPNVIVTAVVCDLMYRIFETLPPGLQQVCAGLMRHVEAAVYSEEPADEREHAELRQVLGRQLDKVPYFAVVRNQHSMLERMEKRATEMQEVVETHLERRRNVLDFIIRLQREERSVLQQWLFQFWAVTYQQRKIRIEKMANVVLVVPQDIVTPFTSWRLFVAQQKLERARTDCNAMDVEASQVAGRIAEVEIENEAQQKRLQSSLEASALLKERCVEEQQEHARLQRLWDATQPELLLSVLAQSLEFLFSLVIRTAKFSGLSLRQRLAGKDVSLLLLEGEEDLSQVDAKQLIIRWINSALAKARKLTEPMLASSRLPAPERALLEMVRSQPDVHNMHKDLADSGALCALYAILKAERDDRAFSVQDLWLLEERDLDLRASQLCALFGPFAPTPKAKCLLAPTDVVKGCEARTSVFLASVFLQEPLLADLEETGETDKARAKERLEQALALVEEFAGSAASEPLEDPTPLLHGGEDYQALATTSTEQLLLRWTNVQLSSVFHRPVENFGSDLQDGEAIGLLLGVVAPEVTPNPLSADMEEKLDQIAAAASRCTDFELLTVNAIVEGQSDMLAAFLAQLFLCRPNLAAKPDSLLAMHLKLLERLCREGLETLNNLSGDDDERNQEVMHLCLKLDGHWAEFMLAAQTVQEASRTMTGMSDRVRAFLGDTLAHRAQGRPKTMLDAKEAREFLFYTALNPEHLGQQTKESMGDAQALGKVEDVLRKHFRLLRDVFRHYAVQTGTGGTIGITLEGLMKFYQDCKLRSRDLAPHHLEVLYCDQLDLTGAPERSLSPQSFIVVLLQSANLKFKDKIGDLPDQLTAMIEQHIKPHACQEKESIFQRMAYNTNVRQVLDKHHKELNIIFDLYARLDQSSAEAMQRVNTMNVKEFQMLLKNCDMLDDTLSETAVSQIFEGIQQSATSGIELIDEGNEGIDDDEELAFSEFLDGLVAIAAYKFPDPFTPFHTRVNNFILKLFGAVRRHWSRKRISPQVDEMLNALQKKLR